MCNLFKFLSYGWLFTYVCRQRTQKVLSVCFNYFGFSCLANLFSFYCLLARVEISKRKEDIFTAIDKLISTLAHIKALQCTEMGLAIG